MANPMQEEQASLYDERPDLYDVQHDDVDEDLTFLATLAEQAHGPILELGCGTGRVLGVLARHQRPGRRQSQPAVWGLDRSAAMLRAAEIRLAGHLADITLVQGDLRNFDLGMHFALIVCAVNTFMELLTPEDQLACLQQCALHLKPDGLLVLDLLNPYDALGDAHRGQLIHQFVRRRADGTNVSLTSSSLVDATAQHIDTYRQYDEWTIGGPVARSTYAHSVRFTHRYEMEHLLARAGLFLDDTQGDYDGAPWTDESARMIVLAGLASSE